ncbi:MAG TPA: isocitrate lyase/phosphoenolpyruvate mutase family protein [Chitinophagaceae bacterium]|nr:isocitrate lyase/phosphoenolpyruvate mutase family protein [Chitinophagaceae bacterium]
MPDLQEKAHLFHQLHRSGEILILPNIWDPLGALLLEDMGFPAVATASAAIAYSAGYNDGENIPFDDLVKKLKDISDRVSVPVSADIESGYAQDNEQLQRNIRQLIESGIAGINIEDTDAKTGSLLPAALQCKKIETIRKTAGNMGVSLFINARTDVFIKANPGGSTEDQLKEAVKRAHAYQAAGADGFYPILLQEEDAIKEMVQAANMPVNVLMVPGMPELSILRRMGVARVSLGPGFLKIAMNAMKQLAAKLKAGEGTEEVASNNITSDYLKMLVNKK